MGRVVAANFLRMHQVLTLVNAKWSAKQPFSLVRIGDGELSILDHSRTPPERVQHVLRRAMSDRLYTEVEIQEMRAGMVWATNTADIVGMYDSFEANDFCTVYEDTLEAAGLEWLTACHPNVHIYMQSCGALNRLLAKADRVTLISGRDILERFKFAYPHITADQHLIPVERQYKTLDENEIGEHYPDVYQRIKGLLQPDGPSHRYLIGAGLLGKEYCSIVKSRGGFALDIGSVFDYWAEVPTREGKKAVIDGRAGLAPESRWPGIFLGSSPIPNGIAKSPFRGMLRPMEITPRPR